MRPLRLDYPGSQKSIEPNRPNRTIFTVEITFIGIMLTEKKDKWTKIEISLGAWRIQPQRAHNSKKKIRKKIRKQKKDVGDIFLHVGDMPIGHQHNYMLECDVGDIFLTW